MDSDGRMMMERAELICIAPHLARGFYPIVADMIDRGFAVGDELVPPDLIERLEDKRMLLWAAILPNGKPVCAVLTELVKMRSGLYCRFTQCGGESLETWRHLPASIEEYARAEGCVKTVLGGREGWERVLSGYRRTWVTLEKVL